MPQNRLVKGIFMRKWLYLFSALLLISAALLAGCQTEAPPDEVVVPQEQLEQLRAQLVANDEPDNSIGVIALRDSFPDEEADDGSSAEETAADPADETAPVNPVDYENVVVVGRVGGKKPEEMEPADFPIVQNEAVFFIVDPAYDGEEHAHEHGDDHDCPFCNKKATEAQAIVRFVGDDGQPLPVCVKALFDLPEEALVVVSGAAELQLDTLVITARQIFIR